MFGVGELMSCVHSLADQRLIRKQDTVVERGRPVEGITCINVHLSQCKRASGAFDIFILWK